MSAQYLVSARKYRPQTFDTVVGQEHITTTLKNAIKSNHLAHAFLFCGPRGVGKTTCARILAKTINCEHPTAETEACGECATCKSFEDNSAFSVFELDAASNNGVDDIRELTNQVRFQPQIGKYKVYIIDEVHMLSTAAFNAFLKTLEEPPAHAIFILATTEKHKILPTILSRCQIFDFKRIQTKDIVTHLNSICIKEGVTAEEAGLHIIAQKSEGCMRDALSMMDRISSFTSGRLTYEQTIEHLNVLDAGFYFKMMDALQTNDVASVILNLENVYKRGFEGDVILNGYAQHLRDLLLCKDTKMMTLLDLPEAHKRMFYEKSQMTALEYIVSSLNIVNDAEIDYKTTLNKRLQVEITFIKLCYLHQLYNASSLIEDAKKKDEPLEYTVSLELQETPEMYDTPIVEAVEQATPLPIMHQHFADEKDTVEPEKPIPEPISVAPPVLPKPKISKDFLSQLQQEAAATVVHYEPIPMSLELGKELYDQYIDRLKTDADKMLQASNLQQTSILFKAPDELVIYCKTNISLIYAQGNLEAFRDYCKQKTHNQNLKIITELAPPTVTDAPVMKSLTKTELFEKMASKNPLLRQLKDGLRLEVDR